MSQHTEMDEKTINTKLTEIWDKYNLVRISGDKKSANKLLVEYINLLKQQDEKEIKIFVDNICSLIFDINQEIISNNVKDLSDNEIRIQYPLFKEVVLPILIDQYKKNSAKHIKWIGQFEQFFYSDRTATQAFLKELDITGYFEARYFFEKSFSIENNQKTLALLLNSIAKVINYYTHEAQTGVLCEPEVLNKEIITFRKYLHQCVTKSRWILFLTQWEQIAKHWSLYFATQNRYENFKNYLKTNGVQI